MRDVSEGYKIKKLQVFNFRNLESSPIDFGPSINCILGQNGNGKTNILEAIHLLSTKKSFRKNTGFPQFLSVNGEKPEVIIRGSFETSTQDLFGLTSVWEKDHVQWFLNGEKIKKRFPIRTVFINPFDSYQFHQTASFRRNWFDTLISQIDESYRRMLGRYQQSLKQKNFLLSKRPPKYKPQLEIYNREISSQIVFLNASRQKFLFELQPFCNQIFKEIFDLSHELEVLLKPSVNFENEEKACQFLKFHSEEEEKKGHSLYGPHRDDYMLLFDNFDSLEYCSLGQQKMTYLSLIFAYIELFRYKLGSFPIVLIDDVSGELDEQRWKHLIDYLQKREFQVLITTASKKFKEELEKNGKIVQLLVESGSINSEKIH